jgi:predicted nucleic acid-binding protein
VIYIDTSVLAAYYCPEPLSDKADEIVTSATNPAISSLTQVELYSAISRKVREGMAQEDGNKIIRQFELHANEQKLYKILDIDHHHYMMAANWISHFNTSLRTLDSLHLAVSFSANLTLITADIRLADAARFFGIKATLV